MQGSKLSIELLLQWHYLIFLLPFGIALVLLVLSSLRIGHHSSGHRGHGAGGHTAHASHGASGPRGHHTANTHGVKGGHRAHHNSKLEETTRSFSVLYGFLGLGRAPVPVLLQAFFLAWGACGYLAHRTLVAVPDPTVRQMLPVFGIALFGGLFGMRGVAELMARVMPAEETLAVSRNGLLGMKGSVAFPVTETAGRIHVYDDHGSLHDEMCRVAAGHPSIARGRTALIVDLDTQGNFIVEEIPSSGR